MLDGNPIVSEFLGVAIVFVGRRCRTYRERSKQDQGQKTAGRLVSYAHFARCPKMVVLSNLFHRTDRIGKMSKPFLIVTFLQ
jgi:hypothetical protein